MAKTSAPESISAKLQAAIDGLRKDVTRVEIWATALSTFAQPVPDYRPDPKYELGRPVATGPLTPEDREKAAENSRGKRRE